MNYNNININLNDIKEYVQSSLIYLNNSTYIDNKLDKDEIITYLSSVDEIIDDIKNDIVKYLYFLKNKIDEEQDDVISSIDNLIVDLTEVKYNE